MRKKQDSPINPGQDRYSKPAAYQIELLKTRRARKGRVDVHEFPHSLKGPELAINVDENTREINAEARRTQGML